MALQRAKSTLSMMQRKATRYQKYLNLSNVFLLITSTILIFTAVILMKFYHVDKLDFWSVYCWLAPVFMIVLGVYTFLVCIFGFVISGSENRPMIAGYAVLLTLAFLAQLASIFMAMELRTDVNDNTIPTSEIIEELNKYGLAPEITYKWDTLQREFHCCGGSGHLVGYLNYRSTPMGSKDSVPDSCCVYYSENCGQNMLKNDKDTIQNDIYINGCMEILTDKLRTDVIPMMVVYAIIGVILALTELITVVLACAYVAQITRRFRRAEEYGRVASAAMMGDDETDKLNHETPC